MENRKKNKIKISTSEKKENPFLNHGKGLNKSAADLYDCFACDFGRMTSIYANKDPERYDYNCCGIIPKTS